MSKIIKTFTLMRRNLSVLIEPKFKTDDLKAIRKKIQSMPVDINASLFDKNTLMRLNACSETFLCDLLNNLNDYDIKSKYLVDTLRSYDDWTVLTKSKLNDMINMFRSLSIQKEVYLAIMSKNPLLASIDQRHLSNRLFSLKNYFTNKHLDKILCNSPRLLTDDMDYIKYKFTYVYLVMGFDQKEMCLSQFFDKSIDYIRERHLFLSRSSFYDKPNKKGLTKFENPRLYQIMDTNLEEYLSICTKNAFDIQDYKTFCEYLKHENFDSELLGFKIGKEMQDQIIKEIRLQRKEDHNND